MPRSTWLDRAACCRVVNLDEARPPCRPISTSWRHFAAPAQPCLVRLLRGCVSGKPVTVRSKVVKGCTAHRCLHRPGQTCERDSRSASLASLISCWEDLLGHSTPRLSGQVRFCQCTTSKMVISCHPDTHGCNACHVRHRRRILYFLSGWRPSASPSRMTSSHCTVTRRCMRSRRSGGRCEGTCGARDCIGARPSRGQRSPCRAGQGGRGRVSRRLLRGAQSGS